MTLDKNIFKVEPFTNYNVIIYTNPRNSIRVSIEEDPEFGNILITKNSIQSFEYYNGNMKNITIVTSNFNKKYKYKIIVEKNNTKIEQIYMNKDLKITFFDDIINLYGLKEYHNPYAPAIFYGLMNNNDLLVLEKHKSLKVIVWIGGDINYTIRRTPNISKMIKNNIDRILKVKKIRHISISSFVRKSLIELNLPYRMVPFMGVNFDKYKPGPKGPCIYLYTSLSTEHYYGKTLYEKIMRKYSHIKFIVACCSISYNALLGYNKPLKYNIKFYNKEELINDIYPQCFLGLRLTDHDGLSGTVQELGLLGIKSIHNGCSPSALNYKTFEDICDHIDREIKTIGQIDFELADKVKEYLTIDQDFFTTNFHSKDDGTDDNTDENNDDPMIEQDLTIPDLIEQDLTIPDFCSEDNQIDDDDSIDNSIIQ
jgi:hypothetical protein